MLAGRDSVRIILNRLFSVHISPERDQTAALVTFTVTMLAENPHVFVRLRNEVLNTLGPRGKVTAENLKVMKYLRAVLDGERIACLLRLKRTKLTMPSETLRLYTIMWVYVACDPHRNWELTEEKQPFEL